VKDWYEKLKKELGLCRKGRLHWPSFLEGHAAGKVCFTYDLDEPFSMQDLVEFILFDLEETQEEALGYELREKSFLFGFLEGLKDFAIDFPETFEKNFKPASARKCKNASKV